jgi:hypothetical protein
MTQDNSQVTNNYWQEKMNQYSGGAKTTEQYMEWCTENPTRDIKEGDTQSNSSYYRSSLYNSTDNSSAKSFQDSISTPSSNSRY